MQHHTDRAYRIVLYVITGCVSLIFCIVILAGVICSTPFKSSRLISINIKVIRAIRHPELYGPRAAARFGGDTTPSQSRARGLTRAILETFPVVKFKNAAGESLDLGHTESRSSDVKNDVEVGVKMQEWELMDKPTSPIEINASAVSGPSTPRSSTSKTTDGGTSGHLRLSSQPQRSQNSLPIHAYPPSRGRKPSQNDADTADKDVIPDAIGRETCPICIVDFEEGDDLRCLPCAGKHRFHQECVDPWLLELSSSCPICRQGKCLF